MPGYFWPLINFFSILLLAEWRQSSINSFQFSMLRFRKGEFQSDFGQWLYKHQLPRMLFSELNSWLQVVGRIFIMRAIFYFVLVYIISVLFFFTSILAWFYTWKSHSFFQQLKRLKDLLVTEWHRMNCSFYL